MRYLLALSLVLHAPFAAAIAITSVMNLPGETGAPVNEEDWSIPLHRCLRSSNIGAGVYDGAERCMLSFPIALPAGKILRRVRALYEDDDMVSYLMLKVLVRNTTNGSDALLLWTKDDLPAPVPLESMALLPNYKLLKQDAAYALVEVRGDTRLLALSYEFE